MGRPIYGGFFCVRTWLTGTHSHRILTPPDHRQGSDFGCEKQDAVPPLLCRERGFFMRRGGYSTVRRLHVHSIPTLPPFKVTRRVTRKRRPTGASVRRPVWETFMPAAVRAVGRLPLGTRWTVGVGHAFGPVPVPDSGRAAAGTAQTSVFADEPDDRRDEDFLAPRRAAALQLGATGADRLLEDYQ